jgi:hypothetical protein
MQLVLKVVISIAITSVEKVINAFYTTIQRRQIESAFSHNKRLLGSA